MRIYCIWEINKIHTYWILRQIQYICTLFWVSKYHVFNTCRWPFRPRHVACTSHKNGLMCTYIKNNTSLLALCHSYVFQPLKSHFQGARLYSSTARSTKYVPDVTFYVMSGVYYIRLQLHLANIVGTNKTCCGWWWQVYQFLICCTTAGLMLQKMIQLFFPELIAKVDQPVAVL